MIHQRRTSKEVRGLKSECRKPFGCQVYRRTSKEVRGLKFKSMARCAAVFWSHLERGAWIEISGRTQS